MDYFDKYAERMRVTGTLTATGHETRITDGLRRDWETSPSYRKVCVDFPDGSTQQIRIQTARKTVGVDKIYVHPDDKLMSGCVILSLQEYSWLVLSTSYIGHIYQQANIVRLNRRIKWIENNTLHDVPAWVKNYSRVDGVDEYYYFTTPENTINIFLPRTDAVELIHRDHRFMIDKIPYKVSRVDNFTHVGATILFAIEDIRNPGDTDEIADYIEIAPAPEPTEIYLDGPTEIIYGDSESYMLKNETDVLPAVWSIDTVDWATSETINNILTVNIANSREHIGKSLLITASYNDIDYTKAILVKSLI